MERVLLRLSDKERETLQLLMAALKVSEYTDDVDDYRLHRRENQMLPSMKEFMSAVVGLTVAASELPPQVRRALEKESGEPSLATCTPLLCHAFEVFRRHKRLNPHHNRSEYGKLVMILQDANVPSKLRALGLSQSLVSPVRTVGDALSKVGASGLLGDPLLPIAVRALAFAKATPEATLERQRARAELVAKYSGAPDDETAAASSSTSSRSDLIERCILSIADVEYFVHSCVEPINRLLEWLKRYFTGSSQSSEFSIAIRSGKGGSCLTHDHDTHVLYVQESLELWRIIQRDILDFWQVVEEDMIIDCQGTYRFCDTGQGFHRMLNCPKTYSRMQSSLREAHTVMGGWVGIKVVHLGDRDVPNALVFIDKYTIIPKMLTPIVHTIERLFEVFDPDVPEQYPGVRGLLEAQYGTCEALVKKILCDFFKHAFDGSGDDGGSCIDGRLTSAWNWCHQLDKKDYYDAFVLTGFTGFDG